MDYRNDVLGGIGAAPPVSRPNHSSFFSSVFPSTDSTRSHRYPSMSQSQRHLTPAPSYSTYNRTMGLQRPFARTTTPTRNPIPFPKSPSESTVSETVPHAARLPSSSSVPTGLAAPKLLFSPLARELRAMPSLNAYPDEEDEQSSSTRHRTFSLPKATPKHHAHPYGQGDKRWAVQTVCDLMVYPRPNLTPHVITPPSSPDGSTTGTGILDVFKAREKERQQWEAYAKRGRSLSFGSTTDHPHQRDASMGRRPSQTQGRTRSGSLGSLFSFNRGRRRSDDVASHHMGISSQPETRTRSSVPDDPFRSGMPPHRYSRSVPDLLSHSAPPRPQPLRTLRIAPSPGRPGAVVVIGRDPKPSRPKALDLSKPLPQLPAETSTPRLPPSELMPSFSQEVGLALTNEFPVRSIPASPAPSSPIKSSQTDFAGDPAHARAYLEKQHQRALKRRAFQAPVMGPTPYRNKLSGAAMSSTSLASPHPTVFGNTSAYPVSPRRKTALEEAIGRSRSASLSSINHPPPTQVKEIYRPGTVDTDSHPPILPAPPIIQPPSPTSEVYTSPLRPYPLSSALGSSGTLPMKESQNLSVSRPNFSQTDSVNSKTSAYTDASEGWSRTFPDANQTTSTSQLPSVTNRRRQLSDSTEDTPTPGQSMDEIDFRDLFFRTPLERTPHIQTSQPNHSSTNIIPFPRATQNVGLGYDLSSSVRNIESDGERDRHVDDTRDLDQGRRTSEESQESRESKGMSDETAEVEIATPVLSLAHRDYGFLGGFDLGSMGSARLNGDLSPRMLLGQSQLPSPPATDTDGSQGGSRPESQDIRISQVYSGRGIPVTATIHTLTKHRSQIPVTSLTSPSPDTLPTPHSNLTTSPAFSFIGDFPSPPNISSFVDKRPSYPTVPLPKTPLLSSSLNTSTTPQHNTAEPITSLSDTPKAPPTSSAVTGDAEHSVQSESHSDENHQIPASPNPTLGPGTASVPLPDDAFDLTF
ncbi:hypothetical protein M231_06025 [Tremella mesenterica]|uniref:Uncharacterized protein n=1 Tax=Tremella mesenterica TaxID=5217 RepID=A0A4Q1BGQ4_TREME|nr:hypothetical protein M231_06025 [Tremella mesenterica]